jgi:dihydroflavonol-4-reductase
VGVVAVTGANGFVGAHVVRELLRRGHEVAPLVGADVDCANLADLPVKPRALDLLDPGSVRAGLAGCDSVIHTAACYAFWLPDPRDFYRVNVDGTRNVLEAARALGLRRMVYTSTGATLSPECPGFRGHYRTSKALGEKLVLEAAASGFPAVVVHPTTVLGPGDRRPTPTGTLIVHFLARRMVVFIEMQQNVVHVADVAAGHVLALERGAAGEHYVLGGDNLSMRALLELLAEITGIPAPRVALPNSLVLAVGAASEWLADHVTHRPPVVAREAALHARDARFFDVSKSRAELGFAPRGAREVLADAVRWFASRDSPATHPIRSNPV